MSNFTEMDCYLFGQATHYDIYRNKYKIKFNTLYRYKSFFLIFFE